MKKLSQKTFLAVVIVAICLIGLLLLLIQIRSTTSDQSHAAGEAISFSLTPVTQNVLLGQTAEYTLSVNAYSNIITGVDITLKFDPSLIQSAQWTTSSPSLSTPINDGIVNLTDGTIRYSAVEISNPILTSNFTLGTIRLTTKALGSGSLSLFKAQVTAQGLESALPITQMTPAQYIVVSPTPTSSLGSITGKVMTSTSIGIANSKVSLSSKSIKMSTTTSSSGTYSFTGIAPGTYKISVSASHYRSASATVTVYSGQTTIEDITLANK